MKVYSSGAPAVQVVPEELPAVVSLALRKVTAGELIERLGDLQVRLLESLDDETIRKASMAQRMVAFGIATDKRQLLSGQPTQIMSVEERRRLTVVVPELVRELARRGLGQTIDQSGQEIVDG